MCSTMLSDAGWGIAFVREELQLGLAPQNLRAVVKQRMRWVSVCQSYHFKRLKQSGICFGANLYLGLILGTDRCRY